VQINNTQTLNQLTYKVDPIWFMVTIYFSFTHVSINIFLHSIQKNLTFETNTLCFFFTVYNYTLLTVYIKNS